MVPKTPNFYRAGCEISGFTSKWKITAWLIPDRTMVVRNIRIAGRRTSMRLELLELQALDEICASEAMSAMVGRSGLGRLVGGFEDIRPAGVNFTFDAGDDPVAVGNLVDTFKRMDMRRSVATTSRTTANAFGR